MYGERLMDVLSSHQLRPAHLNLIYNRLAQMGAEVEQTPEQSCEGMNQAAPELCLLRQQPRCCTWHEQSQCFFRVLSSWQPCVACVPACDHCIVSVAGCAPAATSAQDEQDTASSAGAAAAASGYGEHVDEVTSMPPPAAVSRPATRQNSSAASAAGQLSKQASSIRAESSAPVLAASKSVSSVAAEATGKIKRGGFGVSEVGTPPQQWQYRAGCQASGHCVDQVKHETPQNTCWCW